LNAVLFKDIWPYLDEKSVLENDAEIIDFEKSIWHALEILSGNQESNIGIQDSKTCEIKSAGYDSIFTALAKFKQAKYE
jgi:hypothetical protein